MDTMPSWLNPPALPEDDAPTNWSFAMRRLWERQYEAAFDSVMERVAGGATLTEAVSCDQRNFDVGYFNRWINKSAERMATYREMKKIRADVWADKLIKHAIGQDSMEDVQRSTLAVNSYKWLMERDNREVFGDVKQVQFGGTISITAALEQARHRVLTNVIDVTPIEDQSENAG